MKLVKGLKTTSRKKAVTQALSQPPQTSTQTASPEAKPLNGKSRATSRTVTIEATIDVGFGNRLYVRGEGGGLSWNQGVPLACVESSKWQWTGPASDTLKFKLLLNDAVWAQGEDLVAAPGQKLQVAPAF
jgi:hypothetical protein